jgi:glycosyltransferase involved in cell wall biosynthesis
MPTITVILTVHNLQKYLDAFFSELFAQTFQDFEVVVVDDFSTDCSREIIDQWRQKKGDQIKVLYLPQNLGAPSLTRNAALDSGLISGEYLIFQDGDDSVEPQLLEKLYMAAKTNNAEVAICAYDRVEAETGQILCTEMKGFMPVLEMPPQSDILAFINTSPWNKLWKKELFGQARFPSFKVGEEVVLQFTRYLQAKRIAFVNETLIHYRVRPESIISNTEQQTIYRFAEEIKSCHRKMPNGIYKDTVEMIAFVHIGLSMALRAADNPNINLKEHIRWTARYFKQNYNWFAGNRFFGFLTACKGGIKKVGIWGCFVTYRLHLFGVVLWLYRVLTHLFHMDIKF